ncbi:MAG: hypothetical protein K8R36_18900 [Planctomycetales bacterium]|nr:hypothetical protein [Planctomycetales bacterium]
MSTNPYQPPSQFSNQDLATEPQNPTAATVFGILNILFGVVGLCGLTLSAVLMFSALSAQMAKDNPALQLMETNAIYRTFTQVAVVLGFVATVVLIIAGIGLLQIRPYGRTLSIGYGVYSIVMNVLGMIINVAFVFPALLESANAAGGGPAAAGAWGGLIGGVFGGCMGFVYPGLLLYFMFRPNMVAAFKK